MLPDIEAVKRFKSVKPTLEEIVRRHLPGDFSSWEAENTRWHGKAKIVDGTKFNPSASNCAWAIFAKSEFAETVVGHVDRERNAAALEKLERGLIEAKEALHELSLPVFLEFERATSEQMRLAHFEPEVGSRSALAAILILEQATQVGVASGRAELNAVGDGRTKANLQAAAVVSACREVYEARTGKRAPNTGLEQPDKKNDTTPALFIRFATETFKYLGLIVQVSSALRLLEKLYDARENQHPTSK